MCNRVTNHGDMGTFSKPASSHKGAVPPTLRNTGLGYSKRASVENLIKSQASCILLRPKKMNVNQ